MQRPSNEEAHLEKRSSKPLCQKLTDGLALWTHTAIIQSKNFALILFILRQRRRESIRARAGQLLSFTLGLRLADERCGLVAEGFIEIGRPVDLVRIELAKVFKYARIASRKLFDQFRPARYKRLRSFACRVNAFFDRVVNVL